jgi:hypothetical protein
MSKSPISVGDILTYIFENPPPPGIRYKGIREQAETAVGLMHSICYGGQINPDLSLRLQHLSPTLRSLLGAWITGGCDGKEDFEAPLYKFQSRRLLSGQAFNWGLSKKYHSWPCYHDPS